MGFKSKHDLKTGPLGYPLVDLIDTFYTGIRTLEPSSDARADTLNVQEAIDSGDPIFLTAGTYLWNATILQKAKTAGMVMIGANADLVTVKAQFGSDVSRNMLEVEASTAILTDSAITPTAPAGTDELTVTSIVGISVGDLALFRPTDTVTNGKGEIRKVRALGASSVFLDSPLYVTFADGIISCELAIHPKRTLHIEGITFDTGAYAPGHGCIAPNTTTDALIRDCKFVTGGQQAVYCLTAHSFEVDNCEFRDFNKTTAAYTPGRTGETEIAASASALIGQGYGVGLECFRATVRNSDFYRCRHACAAGGTFFYSSHILYTDNHSSDDLEGAFDFHNNVIYGELRNCRAVRGFNGGWIRGKNISVTGNTFVDEAGDGCRLFDLAENVHIADNTFDTCLIDIRIAGTEITHTMKNITIEQNLSIASIERPLKVTASSGSLYAHENIAFRNNTVLSGAGSAGLWVQGIHDGFVVDDNIVRGAFTEAGTASSFAWFQTTEDGVGNMDHIYVRNNVLDIGASDMSRLVFLDRFSGTVDDNVYGNVLVEGNSLTASGTANGIFFINSAAAISGFKSVEHNVFNEDLEPAAVVSFATLDATPDISQGRVFKTANAGATTITDFDGGENGKKIWVIIGDTNTTIDFTGSGLKGNVGVNWSPTTDDHMTCVYDGTDWFCDISDNTA